MKSALFYRTIILGVTLGGATLLQAASTIQFSAMAYTVAENAGNVALSIQRTNDIDTIVSVDYASADGTATNGLKYTAVSGTLAFGAGETNKAIVVPILDEGFVEGMKVFQVTLSNPTGGAVLGARSTAAVRITDNDKGLQVEFAKYQVREDEGSVLIGVLRGDDGNFPVTVEYTTADGSAKAGRDYMATAGKLQFAAGDKLKLLTIPVLNNAVKEPNRTFRLYLTNATGQVLGSPTSATITILDNDPGIQFESSQYWVRENDGALTVRILRGNDVAFPPFTIDYATTNLTATAGQDYDATTGTLAFAAGESVTTVAVPILSHEQSGPDKKFKLVLSNPSGGAVLGTNTTALITILDTTGMAAHQFNSIAVPADRSVQLTLGGGLSKRFQSFFDLYPIDVSSNLVDWTRLVMLARTNSSTNALTYIDTEARNSDKRFYRTATNNLITPFRQPTGPFPVGTVSRLLTDPSRRNRYGISTNGSFMISVWYPAIPEAGVLPGPLNASPLAEDPWVWDAYTDREVYLVSPCPSELHCATSQAPYPVVLFSHGWTGSRDQIDERGPDLASHGYVVVAVDHFDVFATVFPDGSYLCGDISDSGFATPGFLDRVQDLRFTLDELVRWNAADPKFAGRLNLTSVATMGYSWGGGVAGEVARTDDRVKAVILLDAYLQNADSLVQFGLSKPQIGMYSVEKRGDSTLYNKTTKDAIWLLLRSSVHANFNDYYNGVFGGGSSGRAMANTLNVYAVWFLNKYLKGISDPMPALKEYPLVFNFKHK
jgi:dienelactone hydrolase